MNRGRIVADGPTPDILGDRRLMAANRLELPYGFDPGIIEGDGGRRSR
jgi:cobalt/nickel transport system ATP-binding protein